jgi:CheY-like chemotaxis protein
MPEDRAMGRILVLEPEPEVRELFERIVRRLGHEPVREVGSDSIVAPVDVVLVEPESPRGYAVAREVHGRFPAVPVVCASTVPPSGSVRSMLSPREYLVKPFSVAALERALSDALDLG